MNLFVCTIVLLFATSAVHGGWQLTFSEEFNGASALNTSVWNTLYPFNAVINQELEYYASDAFAFSPTTLKIVANKADITTDLGHFGYTSGLITTKHKFTQTYGYFEMYAKVPQGLGFWPAFWLLPEGTGGAPQEIDIMEMVMDLPHNVYTTYHCNYSTGGGAGGVYSNASFSTGFHKFALQWLPNTLIWYVDGVQTFTFSSPCVPNRPEYILANLAVGGGWPKPPDSSTPFPSYFEIDYIRAYKYVASGGISIAGPGNGISYTPKYDAPDAFAIYSPVVLPQNNVAPGSTVKFTITLLTNSATPNTDLNIQFAIHNITSSLTTLTASKVSTAAGQASTTVSTTFVVPANQGAGYLRVAVGIFSSSWTNYFWQENVFVVGVKKVVGGN